MAAAAVATADGGTGGGAGGGGGRRRKFVSPNPRHPSVMDTSSCLAAASTTTA